jgi:hypothetical protein
MGGEAHRDGQGQGTGYLGDVDSAAGFVRFIAELARALVVFLIPLLLRLSNGPDAGIRAPCERSTRDEGARPYDVGASLSCGEIAGNERPEPQHHQG